LVATDKGAAPRPAGIDAGFRDLIPELVLEIRRALTSGGGEAATLCQVVDAFLATHRGARWGMTEPDLYAEVLGKVFGLDVSGGDPVPAVQYYDLPAVPSWRALFKSLCDLWAMDVFTVDDLRLRNWRIPPRQSLLKRTSTALETIGLVSELDGYMMRTALRDAIRAPDISVRDALHLKRKVRQETNTGMPLEEARMTSALHTLVELKMQKAVRERGFEPGVLEDLADFYALDDELHEVVRAVAVDDAPLPAAVQRVRQLLEQGGLPFSIAPPNAVEYAFNNVYDSEELTAYEIAVVLIRDESLTRLFDRLEEKAPALLAWDNMLHSHTRRALSLREPLLLQPPATEEEVKRYVRARCRIADDRRTRLQTDRSGMQLMYLAASHVRYRVGMPAHPVMTFLMGERETLEALDRFTGAPWYVSERARYKACVNAAIWEEVALEQRYGIDPARLNFQLSLRTP
jgi:hypothetical protein